MTTWTRVALVLLRVAIGWHFLFEGIDKVESWQRGPTETSKVFSSASFLQGATGSFADQLRSVAGDPHKDALERLILPRAERGKAVTLPPTLAKEWQAHFDHFLNHYGIGEEKGIQTGALTRPLAVCPVAVFPVGLPWLAVVESSGGVTGEQVQLALVQSDFEHASGAAIRWLRSGKIEVTHVFAGIEVTVEQPVAQRIRAYRAKLQQIREAETETLPAFGKDVYQGRLQRMKQEAARMRAELLTGLNKIRKDYLQWSEQTRLTAEQRQKGPPTAPAAPMRPIDVIDVIIMWGLVAVGACLLLGLFTRIACVAGAAFLLMVYITWPALPWAPINPRAEGHYFFVTKDLIEMFALVALATLPTGRWAGLDALLYLLWPGRSRQASATPGSDTPHEGIVTSKSSGPLSRAEASAASPTSSSKEPSHGT